jgi:hypothetical protein
MRLSNYPPRPDRPPHAPGGLLRLAMPVTRHCGVLAHHRAAAPGAGSSPWQRSTSHAAASPAPIEKPKSAPLSKTRWQPRRRPHPSFRALPRSCRTPAAHSSFPPLSERRRAQASDARSGGGASVSTPCRSAPARYDEQERRSRLPRFDERRSLRRTLEPNCSPRRPERRPGSSFAEPNYLP